MSEDKTKTVTWIAGVTAIAALLGSLGVNQFFPEWVKNWTTDEALALHFDGVYRNVVISENSNSREYLRFYPDGVVVVTPVQEPANAAQVAEWVARGRSGIKQLSEGTYVISNDRDIEFYTRSQLVNTQVNYQGQISEGGLRVKLHSKSSNGYEVDEEFTFMSVPGMAQ